MHLKLGWMEIFFNKNEEFLSTGVNMHKIQIGMKEFFLTKIKSH